MPREESDYPDAIDTFIHAATDFNPGDAVPSSDFEKVLDAIKQIETHLGTTTSGFPDELKNLVIHQIEQIENIPGDVDILAAQWGYLGAIGGVIVRTATLVIAANDSSAIGKTQADYLCDGVADDVDIQAAIDALPAGGGSVILLEGTFTIASPIRVPDHVTLLGQGKPTLLTAGNAFNDAIIENYDYDALTGNHHITLANFRINGNSANQTVAGHGIKFDASDGTRNTYITLRNIFVEDVYGIGVSIKGTDKSFFDDLTGYNNGIAADANYHNFYFRRCDHNYINIKGFNSVAGNGCKLTLCNYNTGIIDVSDNAYQGLYMGDCLRNRIDVLSYNNGNQGIRMVIEISAACVYNDMRVSCRNNGGSGIYLNAGVRNRISGLSDYNTGCGLEVVDANRNIIIGFEARDNSTYGIQESGTSDDNTYRILDLATNTTAAIVTVGPNNSYDRILMSAVLDLSGGAKDVEVFHGPRQCRLVGYSILYTEASSADEGVEIRVGRYKSGFTDTDWFDSSTSEVSKAKGYVKHFASAALTNTNLPGGDTLTVGTAGGKVGVGEVKIVLQIADTGG